MAKYEASRRHRSQNRLSEHLRLVKNGETIEIVEHSIPIARIEPIAPGKRDSKALLERLYREGIARPPLHPLEKDFFVKRPPVPCSVDAVQILIEERGQW